MVLLSEAELLGIFLESFVTGIFFTLACVSIFAQNGRRTSSWGYSVPVVCFMFTIAMTHLILAFVGNLKSVPPSLSVGQVIGDVKFFVSIVLYTVQTLVGDMILTWRCYIIYSKSVVVVIFPVLGLLGSIAIWIIQMITWEQPFGRTQISAETVWVTAYLTITCAINLYTTLAMAIWCAYNTRKLHLGWPTLFPFIAVLVESGVIYTVATLSALITHLVGSNAQFAMVQVLPSIVGIVYCLMILQIRFNADLPTRGLAQTTGYLDPLPAAVDGQMHMLVE
ncbi:uncharacterized protein STEHIDRAFT_172345 [Stereum hirsutum FP-91666 SS1]|uniref:uncharacterized protein n=1 Tax=Stereum hirsutum (strain FP-91666) TaxID=721885 RepID=UPI0004449307|nr:uncharacterized protein STEHIDRAFT_172345 [Stereum hirsutum FP-91666 SS1]EIM80591.1 hypothetical protein STEHIDRAFT_172345 [Stereum hirsutum FP-91666 SS1]